MSRLQDNKNMLGQGEGWCKSGTPTKKAKRVWFPAVKYGCLFFNFEKCQRAVQHFAFFFWGTESALATIWTQFS